MHMWDTSEARVNVKREIKLNHMALHLKNSASTFHVHSQNAFFLRLHAIKKRAKIVHFECFLLNRKGELLLFKLHDFYDYVNDSKT